MFNNSNQPGVCQSVCMKACALDFIPIEIYLGMHIRYLVVIY